MTAIVTPPTIDAMPPAPLPTDDRATFTAKAFTQSAALAPMVTQVNASNAAGYQNAVAAEERAISADASASAAAASSAVAVASANFKGDWSGLTGPLNVPASVRHAGQYWMLLSNLANVATAQPGVSSSWAVISLAGGSGGARNKIINSGFRVNQRAYTSGAATTAGQYTLDMWKVTGTAGITFSTVNNKTTVTIPTGQTLQQVVEGLDLSSGQYALSWEGTAQGRIAGGSYGASGTVVATITGGADTTIEFNAGTVANVKLELGTAVTPYEDRPYGVELAACLRYCELLKQVIVRNQYSSGFINQWVSFSPKRVVPTFALRNTSYVNGSAGAGNAASTTGVELAFSASANGGYMITDILLTCNL